jgi:hypothetical protein
MARNGGVAKHLKEMDALVAAYPDFLAGHDATTLMWKDGTRMALSDGRTNKTPGDIIANPSIDDIFAWPYPLYADDSPPAPGYDPGRARPFAFFSKMYGDCHAGGSVRLARVTWVDGSSIAFTPVNGADKALDLVVPELKALGPDLARYLTPIAGTYNCRNIAGSDQRSMHAYGAAIDLNSTFGDYWRWDDDAGIHYRNRVPLAIVRIFERHGFIWGGRWAHFDTLHFEYRPEFALAAKLKTPSAVSGQ